MRGRILFIHINSDDIHSVNIVIVNAAGQLLHHLHAHLGKGVFIQFENQRIVGGCGVPNDEEAVQAVPAVISGLRSLISLIYDSSLPE